MLTLSHRCSKTHKKQLTDLEALTEPPSGQIVYNTTIYLGARRNAVNRGTTECADFKTITMSTAPACVLEETEVVSKCIICISHNRARRPASLSRVGPSTTPSLYRKTVNSLQSQVLIVPAVYLLGLFLSTVRITRGPQPLLAQKATFLSTLANREARV